MCGIIGAVTPAHTVQSTLIDALRCMEYRGYDSAGICQLQEGQFHCEKQAGKLNHLQTALTKRPLHGHAGIGHTRWATHGAATQTNAHPHLAPHWAVVHNGIIENHQPLRQQLLHAGATLHSETDSEVIPWLLETADPALDSTAKWQQMLQQLDGAFALAALDRAEENRIWFARRGSPLLLARGREGVLVASDALAVIAHAEEVLYLQEGEWGWITPGDLTLFNAEGQAVTPAWQPMPSMHRSPDKAGFDHYMDKEIHEQPEVLARIVDAYSSGNRIHFPQAEAVLTAPLPQRIVMIACGTSYHAALTARYWLERFVHIPVEVDVASEYRYRNPIIGDGTLLITLSQSGETADTLEALRLFKSRTPNNLALTLCNVDHSSMVRESDASILLQAGAEIGVASTKAFTAQLAVLALFSLALAYRAGGMDKPTLQQHLTNLRQCPAAMRRVLTDSDAIPKLAPLFLSAHGVLFLGRGACYPLALEGALKLKEISYIHAEGYAAGEMKHGPIALVDADMPVVVLGLQQYHLDKVLSNLHEVQARGAKVILLTDAADHATDVTVDAILPLPEGDLFTAPLLAALPLQLLAYHVARAKGTDVDQPRNLAKSVTVE